MKYTAELDFAFSRSQRRLVRQWALAAVGLLLGVQLGLGVWRWQAAQGALTDLQAQQRRLVDQGTRRAGDKLSPDQVKLAGSVQTMLGQLAVPWEQVLGAIEQARPSTVVVDSIKPQVQEGSVTISVSCPDFAALNAFTQALAQQQALRDVMLVSEALADNGGGTLRATVAAHWWVMP